MQAKNLLKNPPEGMRGLSLSALRILWIFVTPWLPACTLPRTGSVPQAGAAQRSLALLSLCTPFPYSHVRQ